MQPASLCESDTAQRVIDIVRTNTHVCSALGHGYKSQLLYIYEPLMNVYKVWNCFNVNVLSYPQSSELTLALFSITLTIV